MKQLSWYHGIPKLHPEFPDAVLTKKSGCQIAIVNGHHQLLLKNETEISFCVFGFLIFLGSWFAFFLQRCRLEI